MDSITHIVLGATIGEALAGRRLGKKAMWLGAVAQSLPDIDFIASSWLDTSHDVVAHRGLTHSFLFVAGMTGLLTLVATRKFRRTEPAIGGSQEGGDVDRHGSMSPRRWMVFFGLQLFIHVFLDAFNAYGTGWFEPFSHYRVSFNVLFVADPFYSVWVAISFIALLILKVGDRRRRRWVFFGLLASSLYLCYCITNKIRVDGRVERELARDHVGCRRYFTTPTPLNSWLWYVVAEDGDKRGFHTGYLSVFDSRQAIEWHYFPRNDSLLVAFRAQEDVKALLWFSQGYYTVERWKDGLVFNDMRFGQMKGWEDGQAHFVFHYFLERPADNAVIVQRGRFAGWDGATFLAFIKRIAGN